MPCTITLRPMMKAPIVALGPERAPNYAPAAPIHHPALISANGDTREKLTRSRDGCSTHFAHTYARAIVVQTEKN